MRKCVLLLLLSVCSIMVYAQREYESVLEGGKVWRFENRIATPPQCGTRPPTYTTITLRGDTIINDIHYKELIYGYWIGQKDGVVYQYKVDGDSLIQNFPVMDFSLNVGDEFVRYEKAYGEADTVELWDIDRFKVVAVSDTFLAGSTDKRPRRCVYVEHPNNPNRKDCWVEGIGSLTDGIIGYIRYAVVQGYDLMQCTQGDEMLYANPLILAQHDSFLKEGKVWTMQLNPENDPDSFTLEKLTLRGDTLIKEVPFKQVYKKCWIHNKESEPVEWEASHLYIGEKYGKVYNWYDNSKVPPLCVMDFSMKTGGGMSHTRDYGNQYESFIITSVSDTVLSFSDDKISRRRLSVSVIDKKGTVTGSDTWIEGVGSVNYGLTDGVSTDNSTQLLLRCDDNGVCIYEVEDYQTSIHNITNGENKNIRDSKKGHYQLNGLPAIRLGHGVYVKDGRKVIK